MDLTKFIITPMDAAFFIPSSPPHVFPPHPFRSPLSLKTRLLLSFLDGLTPYPDGVENPNPYLPISVYQETNVEKFEAAVSDFMHENYLDEYERVMERVRFSEQLPPLTLPSRLTETVVNPPDEPSVKPLPVHSGWIGADGTPLQPPDSDSSFQANNFDVICESMDTFKAFIGRLIR